MLNIIYEDKDVIVIDKPAGIAVHPKDRYDKSKTIVLLLYRHFPEIKNVGDPSNASEHGILRPGIVHRLDKETSGLMVIAKNNDAFFELKKQFQERKVEKKYIALVSGVLEKKSGTIEIPLVKAGPKTQTRYTIHPPAIRQQLRSAGGQLWRAGNIRYTKAAKPALTQYRVLKHCKDYTLVEVTPKTGRQHQIRVHFASINHPVACDKLYGRKAKKCPSGLERHFLHASYLKFRLKNALMEFESALPEDLKKALSSINING